MAKIARHSGLGVSMASTPLRCSRLAHKRIISGQALRRQMLHHLRAEDAIQRGFRQVLQIDEQVGDLRIEQPL